MSKKCDECQKVAYGLIHRSDCATLWGMPKAFCLDCHENFMQAREVVEQMKDVDEVAPPLGIAGAGYADAVANYLLIDLMKGRRYS